MCIISYSNFRIHRHEQGRARNFDSLNPVVKSMRCRILELLNEGLSKIWVRMQTDNALNDQFHIANVLGFGFEAWKILLPHLGLLKSDGRILYHNLDKTLKIQCEVRKFQERSDGIQYQHYWVRFMAPIMVEEGIQTRVSRSSAANIDVSTQVDDNHNLSPWDNMALENLYIFYRKLDLNSRLLIDRHLCSDEVKAYIEAAEVNWGSR